MLCKFLKFSSNILVIDECFDNLDKVGCQSILTTISKALRDVDSIYIITHHTDIEIPCDIVLNIEKNERGISHIV